MDKKTVALLLPFRSAAFVVIFAAAVLLTGKELSSLSDIWSPAATCVNIITIALLVLAAKRNGQSYAELINYKKGSTSAKRIALVTVLILTVGMAGMYLAGFICYGVIPYAAPMMIAPVPKAIAAVNLLLLPVTTAFAEDGLYLGLGVNNIKNKYAAIMVPAFFFALQHCFIPVLLDARFIVYRLLSFLPLTIILCIYYRKKRDLVPVMVGHAFIDLATAAQIIATSFIPGFYDKLTGM